jgi:mRNA deadenylase 3'-5' endonuclease subunit Ccr4
METNKFYSLMQWNISCKEFTTSKSFPKAEPKYLEWEYRKTSFKQIFEKYNCDIVCLQEVDDYETFKNELLSPEKYDSLYVKKDQGVQGISVFYDKNKFLLLKSMKISLPQNEEGQESNQFFQVCFFQEISTSNLKKVLCVITTHLKSGEEKETVRVCQIKNLINYINNNEELINICKEFNCTNLILCGDMNTEPTWPSLEPLFQEKLKIFGEVHSVYNFSDSSSNNYIEHTTFKFKHKILYRVIDYIFYSENIKCAEYSKVPEKGSELYEEVVETGYPCRFLPSDHHYLTFKFQF